MSNRILWIAIVSQALIGLTSIAYAGWFGRSEGPAEEFTEMDKEIEQKLSEPNRWGYSLWWPPSLSTLGLTSLESSVFLVHNKKYSSVDEAERLFIDIYKNYIHKLNSIRTIRPFLAEFPLTPDSANLDLGFKDEKENDLTPPYIADVTFKRNTLMASQYIVINKSEHRSYFKHLRERNGKDVPELKELYAPSVPRSKPSIPVKMVFISKPYPDTASDRALFDFSKAFSKKNNLIPVSFCGVGESSREFWPFQMALCGIQSLQLDDARMMAADCAQQTIQFLKSNKDILKFMKERSTWKHITDKVLIPELHHFAFRISFWDENIDRQPRPYIAEIRYLGGPIKYYTADEHQRLVLAHEESIEDAFAFLKSKSEQGETGS